MVANRLGGGLLSLVLASVLLLMSASSALPQSEYKSSPITKVVLLGTGTLDRSPIGRGHVWRSW